MPVICYLLLAHLLIDWLWQGPYIAENKHRSWILMTVHVAAWSLGISAVLSYFDLFAWWKFMLLFGGHYSIDQWKAGKSSAYSQKKLDPSGDRSVLTPHERHDLDVENLKRIRYLDKLTVLDQTGHLIQIIICLKVNL